MEQLKRHSLAALGKSRDKDKNNRKASLPPTEPTNTIDITTESPPAIFYGNANQSTGALYAGHLKLNVVEPELTLNTLEMKLVALTKAKKPVSKDCPECTSQTTELKHWTFLTHPKRFAHGASSLPFSYLIPGHLPISTHGDLGMIQYFLIATAVPAPSHIKANHAPHPSQPSESSKTITFKRELQVSRAVKPLDQKTSLRIFPPTNLTARVMHDPIIHPIGETNVTMSVSGICENQKDTQARWRLRRLNWRLEETEKMISPACDKHAAKVGGQGRGIAHDEVRTVGRGEMKSGWKTDLSEGTIEMEFAIRPQRPSCDVDSPNGLVVTHALVIELIIAEEWAQSKTPDKAIPTGAARVLRMQFAVMVTERSGMGISWDEEQPPMYEDVPPSPPWYPQDDARKLDTAAAYDIRNPYAGGSAPPGYAEGIEEEETPDMQRTRSELLNYTGTPLGPSNERFDEEDFEGLSLGPSRMAHRNVSRGVAGPSSSVIRPSQLSRERGSGSVPRSRLGLDDLAADGFVPRNRDDNDTPRPPSPREGQVN